MWPRVLLSLASPTPPAGPPILLYVGISLGVFAVILALAIIREIVRGRRTPAPPRVVAPIAPPAPPLPAAPPPAPIAIVTPVVEAPPAAPPVPTYLPLPGALFVGREQELDDLTARLRRAHGPSAIAVIGPPGAGKHSTIARAVAAHRAAGTFSGGYSWHVCTDYHGDIGLRRLLIDVLDRFGGPAVAMTTTLRMGEAAVVDLVRGQHILFWLDDVPADFPLPRVVTTLTARDAAGNGPALILTSRGDWAMPEVSEVAHDPPQLDEALDLLRSWLDYAGRATDADDYDALKAICVNVASSPLALRLAAGHAAQQGARLAKLAADLGTAVYPPGDPTRAAERVIAFVESALFPQSRLLFAVLGVLDGPGADLDTICAVGAAVTGATIPAMQADLEHLALLGLIEPDGDEEQPRVRLHPLVQRHAAARFAELSAPQAARARAALSSVRRARRAADPDDELSAAFGNG